MADAPILIVETQLREQWSAILGAMTDLFFLVEESGRLEDVNLVATRCLGLTRDELLAGSLADVVAPDAREDVATKLAQAARDESAVRFETRLRRKAGSAVSVELTLRRIASHADGPARVVVLGRDIGERRDLEEERRATTRLFELIQQPSSLEDLIRNAAVLLRDLSHCAAVGIRLAEGDDFPYCETIGFPPSFVHAERYLCERDGTGRVLRDANGKPLLACFCGSALSAGPRENDTLLSPRGTFWTNSTSSLLGHRSEGRHIRNHCNREGYESVALLPLRVGKEVFGLVQLNDKQPNHFTPERVAILEHATDCLALAISHRRDRAAREVSEERFRRLLESTTDYSYAVEHREGRQVQTRHGVGCEKVTGYTVDEFAARPSLWLDMVVPEDHAAVLAFAHRIDEGETPAPIEHRIVHKNGSIKWVRNTVVSRPSQGAGGFIHDGLISDITDRRRLESQLRQAQKMEAMGQLAGGVAHDFNNILATMLMELGLLREEPDLSEGIRTGLHELETSVARATGLTRQILAFSRRQLMQMKPLHLGALLTDLHKMLMRMLGETIDVELETAAGDHTIKGDGGMIEQVVMNLCVNARDAMPAGGRIRLTVAKVLLSEADVARNPEARLGHFVRLSVKDTGCGMNETVRQHLFEPFFTTKETGKGTGLGLSTVYGIVKQHDGWIEVESQEGLGSTFHVLLPAFDMEAPATPPDESVLPPRGRGETLLVVEDEPALRLALVSILRRFGYKVLEAEQADAAQALWRAHGPSIDLLVTDMVMPGEMSGLQLIQALRAERPQLQAIICSGYLGTQGIPASADIQILPKPFETATLLRTVRRSLDEKLGK
jgi:PAS domain S-box-containing protein